MIMKLCPVCSAEVLDNFDLCWKCLNEFDAQGSSSVKTEIDLHRENEVNVKHSDDQKKIKCLRCDIPLQFVRSIDIHEGTRFGVLGNLAELFVNKASFMLYRCPSCGKVEFYLPK
jgi:hypothetical protein